MRRLVLLLGLSACTPAAPQLHMNFALKPPVVDSGGQSFDVTVGPATAWTVFAVRLKLCDGLDYTEERFSWTQGFVPDPQTLKCTPDETPPSCANSGRDLYCCTREQMPGGPWCDLDVLSDAWEQVDTADPHAGEIFVDLLVDSTGALFKATFEAPHLTASFADSWVSYDATDTDQPEGVVLELGQGDWLASVADTLAAGTDVTLDPDAAEHDVLLEALLTDAALFADPDENGFIDDDERAAGALGTFSVVAR